MIIGLDIDNVIADLDKTFLDEFLIEDKKKRNRGIINPEAEHMTQGMFDWTKEEIEEFLNNNMERMASNFEVVENAKYYIDKLIKDGNKIYLITGRNRRFKNKEKNTIDWLKKNKINYHKLIFSCNNGDKSIECIKNHVDIMFDDRPLNCIKIQEKGIKSYLFKTKYNYKYSLGVEIIDNWNQLYNLIKKLRGKN